MGLPRRVNPVYNVGMLFNSFEFLVFFPVVSALYFAIPHRFRWAMLLAASAWFYMAFVPWYILILVFTIAVDYAAGLLIERSQGRARKTWLAASIAANLGVLAFFKYGEFGLQNLERAARFIGWNYPLPVLSILLPIGLSFHTFQALSYTIEVYRGHQKAERHPGVFALYVLFYPQLVAGPIERPQNLLHQFHEKHSFDPERAASGLRLMAWGFFKKIVIADRLALCVNHVYRDLPDAAGPAIFIATVCFAYQIYCDFSGYSDIARGTARVMGFELMRNFDDPYSSRSVSEFWRRWHVSLSTWFRDYVYVPLGGNRVGPLRWSAAVMTTFLLSGLWHGAAWNFVIWGALNGLYLVAARFTERFRGAWRERVPRVWLSGWQTACTFALVTFAWLFFRAPSAKSALVALRGLFRGWEDLPSVFSEPVLGIGMTQLPMGVAAVLLLELVQRARRRGAFERPARWHWPAYWALGACVLLFGTYKHSPFIYFQF